MRQADDDDRTIPELLRELWDLLYWDEYQKSYILQRRLGLPNEQTSESIRDLCKQLVYEGFPIASCSDGFCKTIDPAKIAATIKNLMDRASAIVTRSQKLSGTLALGYSMAAFEEKADSFFGERSEGNGTEA